jgi:glycosyltransferase involved in cell wall biosynthesis
VTEIRVLHVPGRTPYARKLHGDGIRVLNGATASGLTVPRDATLAWLLGQRPWDWWDVLHLHHPDFEPIPRLRTVLAESRRVGKRVVFTAHDVTPVFGGRAEHHARLRTLAEHNVPFVCLTPASAAEVRWRFAARAVMIPHGYVASPGTPTRAARPGRGRTRFVMYGSLRRNRDVELVLACWRYARHLAGTTLHLLLRAPSRANLAEDAQAWRAIREHATDPRLRVDVLPFPTDRDVNEAVAGADCLLLPYRWASHSGQLEHAFDLGVLPVAARTGYLPDQVALHNGLAVEPVWFDWADGASYDYGARLLEAMQAAHAAIEDGWQAPDVDKFAEHRRREHADVMAAFRALYEGGGP